MASLFCSNTIWLITVVGKGKSKKTFMPVLQTVRKLNQNLSQIAQKMKAIFLNSPFIVTKDIRMNPVFLRMRRRP